MNAATALTIPNDVGAMMAVGPGDLVLEWHAHLDREVTAAQMSADTAATYRRGLARFQEWGQGQLTAGAQPDRRAVLEWVADLRARKLAVKTIAIWLTGARAFFQWAVSEGYIGADPTAGVKAGKRLNTKRHVRERLSDEEVGRLLSLASLSKRDRALIWLALFTAARSVELWRADIEDIRDTPDGMLFYVQGKGRSEKDEPLVIAAKVARDALRDYRAELAEHGHVSGPLFIGERRRGGQYERIARRTLRLIVKATFRKAGIIEPRKTAHSIRHTALSSSLD
jgi:site-specific recombinase XerD